MFPIIDIRGNVIGFGGRVLDDSKPKYLNSPETVIFNKRKNLFAMNVAKKTKEEALILTEGYMDADYLTPTQPTQLGDRRIIRNKRANGLNLRAAPSTGGELLTFIPNNSQVIVLGELSDGWCYVLYENLEGYMLGSSLESIR